MRCKTNYNSSNIRIIVSYLGEEAQTQAHSHKTRLPKVSIGKCLGSLITMELAKCETISCVAPQSIGIFLGNNLVLMFEITSLFPRQS